MARLLTAIVLILVINLTAVGVTYVFSMTYDQAMLYLLVGVVAGVWADTLTD